MNHLILVGICSFVEKIRKSKKKGLGVLVLGTPR